MNTVDGSPFSKNDFLNNVSKKSTWSTDALILLVNITFCAACVLELEIATCRLSAQFVVAINK